MDDGSRRYERAKGREIAHESRPTTPPSSWLEFLMMKTAANFQAFRLLYDPMSVGLRKKKSQSDPPRAK